MSHPVRKRILVICPYPENEVPGQRLKFEQYYPMLRASGFDIEVRPFFTRVGYRTLYTQGNLFHKIIATLRGYLVRIFDLFRLRAFDGIYVFLYVTPFGSPLFEALYHRLSRRMIYDIDDLVFLGRTTDQNWLVRVLRHRSKYHYLMKHANHVITCTPYLDEYVRRFNPYTSDISSTINTVSYIARRSYAIEGPITLGWSGSHSTAPYLAMLQKTLIRLREREGVDFRLLAIGVPPGFTLPDTNLEVLPWNAATEVQDLSRIDIGLYPLPDEEWVLGKSGLKALQYMALGIPTIATALGAIHRVIEDGKSGFLVKTEDEWIDRLKALTSSEQLRAKIGRAARIRVEQHFSIKANEPRYLAAFESIFRNF